jgi:hypothetical protein
MLTDLIDARDVLPPRSRPPLQATVPSPTGAGVRRRLP